MNPDSVKEGRDAVRTTNYEGERIGRGTTHKLSGIRKLMSTPLNASNFTIPFFSSPFGKSTENKFIN